MPINTWTRVDVMGMFAKVTNWAPGDLVYLASMFVLIALPCWVLWKSPDDENVRPLSSLLIVLAMLVTIYHHSYDCLLVSVACVGLLLNAKRTFASLPSRVSLATGLMLAAPMLNYLSTKFIRDKFEFDPYGFLWQSITMINGVCLLTGLLVAIWYYHSRLPIQARNASE